MKNLSQILFMLTLSVTLISCGQGFQSNKVAGSKDGNAVNNSPQQSAESWAKVAEQTEGQTTEGQQSNQLLIKIDKENQAIILILPLPPIFMGPLVEFEVPNAPGVIVKPITNEDGGESLAVSIPLRYIHKKAQFRDFLTLPNGSPLPFLPVGEMVGFAVSFPQNNKYRLHIYVAVSAAAVFVETPDMDNYYKDMLEKLPILPRLAFPIKNKKYNTTVGWLEFVLPKNTYSSGVYVASKLPIGVAQLINELVRF